MKSQKIGRPRFSGGRAVVIRAAPIVLVLLGCFSLFRGIDFAAVARSLQEADLLILCFAAIVNFILLGLRTVRWRVLMSPLSHLPLPTLYKYNLIGSALSAVLPARAGEAARVILLRRHGVPALGSTGVLLLEKVYDAVGLILFAVPLPFVLSLPRAPRIAVWLATGGGIIALLAVFALAAWTERSKRGSTHWIGRLGKGVEILHSSSRALLALLLSILARLVDIAVVILTLHAFDGPTGFWTGMLVLFFVDIALTIPALPAGLGAVEAAVVFAILIFWPMPKDQALAPALAYRAVSVVPVVISGLSLLAISDCRKDFTAAIYNQTIVRV